MQWYRRYNGTVNDPKFRSVAKKAGAHFTAVLCVWDVLLEEASEAEDRGRIEHVDPEDIACTLDLEESLVKGIVDALYKRGLLIDGRIASWDRRQKKSDSSLEYVKKHRALKAQESAVSEPVKRSGNVTESPLKGDVRAREIEREKDTETDSPRSARVDPDFERFWSAYPKRDGGNPKKPAQAKFKAAIKSGTSPDTIIAGAQAFASECFTKGTKPQFVPMAQTWLHQERWENDDNGSDPVSDADLMEWIAKKTSKSGKPEQSGGPQP